MFSHPIGGPERVRAQQQQHYSLRHAMPLVKEAPISPVVRRYWRHDLNHQIPLPVCYRAQLSRSVGETQTGLHLHRWSTRSYHESSRPNRSVSRTDRLSCRGQREVACGLLCYAMVHARCPGHSQYAVQQLIALLRGDCPIVLIERIGCRTTA